MTGTWLVASWVVSVLGWIVIADEEFFDGALGHALVRLTGGWLVASGIALALFFILLFVCNGDLPWWITYIDGCWDTWLS